MACNIQFYGSYLIHLLIYLIFLRHLNSQKKTADAHTREILWIGLQYEKKKRQKIEPLILIFLTVTQLTSRTLSDQKGSKTGDSYLFLLFN